MIQSDIIQTPEDFRRSGALGGLLRALDPEHIRDPDWRKGVSRNSPLVFSFIYLRHKLRSKATKGRYSLNPVHIHLARTALEYKEEWGPAERRRATIAPRESGKSTWDFEINPLWAMAFGYRTFPALFSDGGRMSKVHFRNVKRELESNALLKADFPDLCTPATRRGNRADVDNETEYHSRGGHTIMAKGIMANSLGLKSGEFGDERPDLILLDDVEPAGGIYSRGKKAKRLAIITEAILPMNLNAPVDIVGTTTMYDSIMHDLVRAATGGEIADWIDEENFIPSYFPAIVRDENGRERSIWPARWPYSWLAGQRGTRGFDLNFMNMPRSQGKGFWDEGDFRYNFPWTVEEQILSIDPAVKARETSDYTGIAIIGTDASRMNVCVEWARGVRLKPRQMRELVHHIINTNPKISTVIVEANNGGDYVTERFLPFPRKLHYETPNEHLPKHERISELQEYYERDWVWHVPGLMALEEQQIAYPDVDHDDIVDAVAKGVHYLLQHRPLPVAG